MTNNKAEYLVSHGKSGGFGRFAAEQPLACRRGDRVVVQGSRGLELGTVLCPASERQQRLLEHTPVGQVMRLATAEDQEAAEQGRSLSHELFTEGRRLADRLALPVEILDVEVCLDGRQAILQCLAPDHGDFGPLLDQLESRFSLTVLLENLATVPAAEEEEHGGCGEPGCGRAAGGGCTDCGSGGCSSCGSSKVDMRNYFAHLRTKMEEHQQRTSLL